MPRRRSDAGAARERLHHRREQSASARRSRATTPRSGARARTCSRGAQAALAALAATLRPRHGRDLRRRRARCRGARSAPRADFVARFGAPDVVIANAGISRGTLTGHREDLAGFRAVFDTNVLGLVHTFQPFLAAMRDARARRAGRHRERRRIPRAAGLGRVFSASKAAAITYLESLRVELRGSGVAVVTICPGFIATPMTANNPYPMPFLLRRDKAARLIARAIARRKRFYVLPWQMALVGRAVALLPRPLYDAAFARAPRKPRRHGLQ